MPNTKTLTIQRRDKPIMSIEEKENFVIFIWRAPWLYKHILDTVRIFAPKSKTLLDVGCGDGFLLKKIHKLFPNILLSGLDIDSYFVTKAKKESAFNYILGDALNIKYKYDIVTCNLALHHFAKPLETIKVLAKHTDTALIISDQLRPSDNDELIMRLKKRTEFVGKKDVPYYRKNEQKSILEAFSENEIKDLFNKTKLPFRLKFYDDDYYKRFVAVLDKNH